MSDNNNNEKKIDALARRLKAGAFALITSCIGGPLLLFLMESPIIIYMGIRAYRILWIVVIALIVGAAAFAGISLFSFLSERGKLMQNTAAEEVTKAEKNEPLLKAKGTLDPVAVARTFSDACDQWTIAVRQVKDFSRANDFEARLNEIQMSLQKMDKFQEKLKILLDTNGAEALRDTEEVLGKSEQHLLRNVRKLLNTMTILNPRDKSDIDTVDETAKMCIRDNEEILDKTREFLVAVTSFLNSQGEQKESVSEVEVYKQALLSQMQSGGIY